MEQADVEELRQRIARYDFRGLHPRLHLGTASDRYAGWIGQIYPEQRWSDRVSSRRRKLGGQSFEERQVPIASAADYFEHFSVLELDFTFYRPLLDDAGNPGTNVFVLQKYTDAAPEHARFILKAPQAYSARVLRRGRGYVQNPTYLDAGRYNRHFATPAREMLGERLTGVIFEQEYNRVSESPPPENFAAELERFFELVESGPQVHLEIRSPHLLEPPYFDMLRRTGLGFCFSHWTYLPSIQKQWEHAGSDPELAFSARDGQVVLRLLTPRNVPYAEAYARAYPFDRAAPDLSETPEALRMVDEATALVLHALEAGRTISVIANNRAWGNAPALAQAVGARVLEFAPQRAL